MCHHWNQSVWGILCHLFTYPWTVFGSSCVTLIHLNLAVLMIDILMCSKGLSKVYFNHYFWYLRSHWKRVGYLPHGKTLHSTVTPIFKKGCRSLPSNYRPVSLTSIVCKMLECIYILIVTIYCKGHIALLKEWWINHHMSGIIFALYSIFRINHFPYMSHDWYNNSFDLGDT